MADRVDDPGRPVDAADAQYLDLFEEGPVAYFSTSRGGRIRMANRRAVELTRYDLTDLIGLPVLDLYAEGPHGIDKARAVFAAFRRGETISGEELQWRRADGAVVWVQLWVRPITDAQGRIVASRSVAVDISHRKQAEQDRAEAIAAREEAVATEQRFLSMVSHEIRTPLGAITGFAQLLLEQWEQLDDGRREEMLQRTLDAAHRMGRLVEEFLQLASQDGVEPHPQEVDVAGLVGDTAAQLDDPDEVEVDVPDGLQVRADPLMLDQIVTNLLVNAQRHGIPPIEVVARRLPDGGTQIAVRDHGSGVPEEFVPELFDRFAQAAHGAGGSGLGLAIARDLAQAHGGELVHEPADPGARFVLRLRGRAGPHDA